MNQSTIDSNDSSLDCFFIEDFIPQPDSKVHSQQVYLYENALRQLDSILKKRSVRRIFLVLDEMAWRSSGADEILDPVFATRQITRFTKFEPNPKIEDVELGIKEFRHHKHDLIIALGGGTAIDLAKMIGAFSCQQEPARELATGAASLKGLGPALVAIPTTSGTGSEATHFAVVYVDGQKYSVAEPSLLPDIAMIDPFLTWSLPPAITSTTGLDAFCQAMESIWAVGATEESIGYATEAVMLAYNNLPQAIHDPTSESRLAMCRASHLAGKAINIGKTTLPHAISYAITSEYGIPHGAAVAMTLSGALAFNMGVTEKDCLHPRGSAHVKKQLKIILDLLGVADVQSACLAIREFMNRVGSPGTLEEAGIETEEEYKQIAACVNLERMSNNPRHARPEDLLKILNGEIFRD